MIKSFPYSAACLLSSLFLSAIPAKTSGILDKVKTSTVFTVEVSLNQQLPILPGRFQPSTFGVCELNYRVRHGYGCILTAIATESLRVYSLKTI